MRLITLAALLLLAPGCKKKPPADVGAAGGVVEPPKAEAPKAEAPAHVQELVQNFQKVFFDFDSATLDAASKAALDTNARILADHPDVRVEVQGHADERGTTEYNLALGQKRADAVVNYLQAAGVASTRVKVVSYGEERPAVSGSSETAWAQNRRAEFVVIWGDATKVQGTTGG